MWALDSRPTEKLPPILAAVHMPRRPESTAPALPCFDRWPKPELSRFSSANSDLRLDRSCVIRSASELRSAVGATRGGDSCGSWPKPGPRKTTLFRVPVVPGLRGWFGLQGPG